MTDDEAGWNVIIKLLEAAIDMQDSVAELNEIMATSPNKEVLEELKQRFPDRVEPLRQRFIFRRAHLYATGRAEPAPR